MPEFEITVSGRARRVALPDRVEIEVGRPRWREPVPDAREEIARAVGSPIGCPSLVQMAAGARRVAIILTDITRKPPEREILDVLFAELARVGVTKERIALVVATGMHRPNTADEIRGMYGTDIYARVGRIENHDARDPARLVDLGRAADGRPIVMNRTVTEADLVLSTGVIEVHLWAGCSGGSKTAAIGAAGFETITGLHSYRFATAPGVALGRVEGNPFRDALDEIGERAGLGFVVNAIQRADGRLVRAVAGHPVEAFREGVHFAREQFEIPVPGPFDAIVAVPGYPKDRNLYQASRAVNPVFFGPQPVLREGGAVIVPARCGDGLGDEELYDLLAGERTPAGAVARVAREDLRPGGQLAGFKLARALARGRIIVTDCDLPGAMLERMHLGWAPTVEAALAAEVEHGAQRVLVLPEPMVTLLKISSQRERTPTCAQSDSTS